jgi:hypothetical protein
MTLEDAMGNNLKDPPAPCKWGSCTAPSLATKHNEADSTAVENEIRTHFRLKSKAIKAQLEE